MDTISTLTAELYFWGHIDVLQNAAGQFAQKGNVDYQKILDEKIEHHLRTVLDLLPQHQLLKEAVEEWFYTAEFFSKKHSDWDSWDFPNDKEFEKKNERQKKSHLLPVMHLCKLAVDAFDIASDGRLCCPDEEDIVYFTRMGCVPPALLCATRYAMRQGAKWNGKNTNITSEAATQEFQTLIKRGMADAHVHLSSSVCFTDLFYAAIRGIAPPCLSYGGDFLENGNTHGKHDFPFHRLAMRPLLLACKTMLAALLHHAKNPQEKFKVLLDDDTLSRQFWSLMYDAAKNLAAKIPDSNFANRFEISVGNILKKVGNYKRFFNKNISFEKNWFTIVRHVLETQNDNELCYHFTQLTHCICCLYYPTFHREGSYEFGRSYGYIRYFIEAAGHPDGRSPRRFAKDEPLESIGYDSMQSHCQHLRRLQLRIGVDATKKRSSYRQPRENARKPPLTERRLEVELQNHLATYKRYIEEQKSLSKRNAMIITFPIHFLRREKDDVSIQRKIFSFKSLWHRIELLASLFQENPALRYFFGRIDVCSNEDLKPNWIFALMFQELEERLKKITCLNSEMIIPRIRYNCHAGEHFTSSIQGLRRIWEPVHYFPRLAGIGHAFALGISDRFPTEMPADELLDDLVWVLLQREHIQGVSLELIERIGERIAEEIYGTSFDKKDKPIGEILFRDLKDAYRWRFKREKIEKYVGVLSHDKKTGEYHYNQYFELSQDEKGKTFPKAAKILQKHFTNNEVGRPYKLTKELCEILEKCYTFLRDFVKQEIINKNIVVEVCPASNFRVGNLTKVEDHPLFAMCPPDKGGGISVVFGSDDPAMFQTSIDDEYLFIKEAMDKKYPDLPLEKRLEYLETIRRRSMELCCDDLPDDPREILNLIGKAGVK